MNPALILAAIDGALTLIEKLGPVLADAFRRGEITLEQQAALDARIAALRPGGTAFAGPEWEPDPEA